MSTAEQETTDASANAAAGGVAGRTNYGKWDKVTSDLVKTVEMEEEEEEAREKAALGLDGKYARSQAEAEERQKAKDVENVKKKLDQYKKREAMAVTTLSGLLGPVVAGPEAEESKSAESRIVRITRDRMDAGKRVITLCDTSGSSADDKIVLTQDLSHLESKVPVNAAMRPKKYDDDAENDVRDDDGAAAAAGASRTGERSVFGIIKAFVNNVHNCTVLIRCKIITGTIEIHGCTNVVVGIESDATVATVQADLCSDLTIDFRDAPSGKNVPIPGRPTQTYWGDDADDRIFHAGVSGMRVRVYRDGYLERETDADYLRDGAEPVGNAAAEEVQFITAVVDGDLRTERVARAGSSTGRNARAMTERELQQEKEKRARAADMAIEKAEQMVKIMNKDGQEVTKVKPPPKPTETDDEEIEEVYASMSKEEIHNIVEECGQNKERGNEAFKNGEYGQAILLYSLSLDKAEELPDKDDDRKLFPRDVVYSNRAACFLKLGQHEKAEADAKSALEINPDNIKANFRRGLALHAMARYQEALPFLARAHKQEPKNKQVKQALQFCEVRLEQEMRRRMQG